MRHYKDDGLDSKKEIDRKKNINRLKSMEWVCIMKHFNRSWRVNREVH